MSRKGSYYLKLDNVSEAMQAKPRVHSVDTFTYSYKLDHPEEVVPSTQTLYNDFSESFKQLVLESTLLNPCSDLLNWVHLRSIRLWNH